MSKVALLDIGKYQNEQSRKVSWVWFKNCKHGDQILGSMGHNGPCKCGIGLKHSSKESHLMMLFKYPCFDAESLYALQFIKKSIHNFLKSIIKSILSYNVEPNQTNI